MIEIIISLTTGITVRWFAERAS